MEYVRRKTMRWAILPLLVLLAAFGVCSSPVGAYAADGSSVTVKVADANAVAGDNVEVSISVEGNPGILGAVLKVAYDDGLTLTGAANGTAFSALSMMRPGAFKSPCEFSWDGVELDAGDVRDGDVLVLSFDVSSDARPGSSLNVTVSGDEGAVVDRDLNAIDVTYVSGAVHVSDFIPGDVDDDGLVNSKDVIYTRRNIVGGYAQSINVAAADVNNDKKVNSADVILMRRFIVGGYGVELKRSDLQYEASYEATCAHALEAVAAHSPTCTENGNIAYWHCKSCGKYFSDALGITQIELSDTIVEAAGHKPVIDPAVAPTRTSTGLTEGSHCAVCQTVLSGQQTLPMLGADEHFISYDLANGDTYLAGLAIENPNKTSYCTGESFRLSNLSADGYRFLGWYDGAGDDSQKVTHVTAEDAEDLELYAHWQVITYTVQYKSDLFLDTDSATYTVDKGLVLPTPKLSNYVFAGWSDTDGVLYADKKIPVGMTGNLTLTANWTSERNKTYTNPAPTDPFIVEDDKNDVILLSYEIGRIENVPLYTIRDFGYISGDGVTREAEETYAAQTSQTTMEQLSNVVANATTNSSNWTLSNGWNEATSISEEWCKQNGYTREEAETIAKSDSSNWNISNSKYGATSSTSASSSTDGWSNEIKTKYDSTKSTSDGRKTSAELNAKLSAEVGGSASAGVPGAASATVSEKIGAEVGGSIGMEGSHSDASSRTSGFESAGSQTHSGTISDSSTNTAGWNSSSSYGGSSTTSKSNTVSTALSEQISQKTGYGKSYAYNGSETQGLAASTSTSQSDSYTSSTTFNTVTSETVKNKWTTAATKSGYHRWILAGTAHVFGVVGYDMNTRSFFVYTYSVMDDETHEFEDYSYTTDAYNDNENGVISFEVPYDEVMSVVSDRVYASEGLKVDLESGEVVGYTGTDTCVIVPEYYNAGNGDVRKITGFTKDAFAGNTDIVTVVLSDYIDTIPDGAFAGCSSLAFVQGAGVTSIGASAFAQCPSMKDCGLYSTVTHLGDNAFEGAERLYVNAANAGVAKAAMASGAKGVVLNLRLLEDNEDVLNGVTLNAPSTMDYFELNGDLRTFNGLRIDSKAAETVLNKVNIAGDVSRAVKIASPKVTLNQTSIKAPGIALVLTADEAEVGLRGTSAVSSTSANAMLCKNAHLYETAANVVGKLVVPQKLLVCGTVDGTRYLQCDNVETIGEDAFDKLMNSNTLRFDVGDGECDEVSREIVYGVAVGKLPVPTRDGYAFDGWYLQGSDTLVTESTILPVGDDLTLVAHWARNYVTDLPNGVYSISPAKLSGYSLCLSGGVAAESGTKLALRTNYYSTWERFKLAANADGSYRITHLSKNLALGVGPAGDDGCAEIALVEDSDAGTQHWYIERSADDHYALRNKSNGSYMTVAAHTENGQTTMQLECGPSNSTLMQAFALQQERYALHDSGMTWSAAKALCEEMGGHLVTITSSDEQAVIAKLVSTRAGAYKNCYWLGGKRQGTTWHWVTGEPFSYSNWDTNQPDSNNNGLEDTTMIYSKNASSVAKWNDVEGNRETYDNTFYSLTNFGFICEWEATPTGSLNAASSSLTAADSIVIGG